MTTWSRRDVLQGAAGMLVAGLAGAAAPRAQAAPRPPVTVYRDPG
jgi:hypothetical protein